MSSGTAPTSTSSRRPARFLLRGTDERGRRGSLHHCSLRRRVGLLRQPNMGDGEYLNDGSSARRRDDRASRLPMLLLAALASSGVVLLLLR